MLVYPQQAASGLTALILCPPSNPLVISGGYNGISGGGNGQYVNESEPIGTNAWRVTLENSDANWNISAICSK
jgi:hypothetical protein